MGRIVLTWQEHQAMQYVVNSRGWAIVETFIDNHAPFGHGLWHRLSYLRLVEVRKRRIFLTSHGEQVHRDYLLEKQILKARS